ncbi:MAG: glycosyltransferase [Acidobacteriaceae bacterium]
MIVKNGGDGLRSCLESAKELVHQIVIADTGSTDNTVEIAKEFGAVVISIPWKNHYADARNASLAHITTDWVLVLDADEELSLETAHDIPALLTCGEDTGGFQLIQRNYLKECFVYGNGRMSRTYEGQHERAADALSYLDNPICRIFRKHPQLHFQGRIHELVEPQLSRAGFKLVDTNLMIHHFGKLCGHNIELEKQLRYRDILRAALDDTPDNSSLWVQLGLTENNSFHNKDEALRCYQNAVALNHPQPDAWIGLAILLLDRKEYKLAIEAISHLNNTGDQGIIKKDTAGDVLHDLGQLKEARVMYLSALKLARLNRNSRAIRKDIMIESKLGYTEVRLGMHRAGLAKLYRAVEALPTMLELHNRLVKALVFLQRDHEAADAAEATLLHFISENIISRAAALRMRIQQYERAQHLLETGIKLLPESELLHNMLTSLKQTQSSTEVSISCQVF